MFLKKNPKAEIGRILADRVPNFVSEVTIRDRLSNYSDETISVALAELLQEDTIENQVDARKITGRPISYYRLKNIGGVPVRETIKLGDSTIPRLLSDSSPQFMPETFNEAIEAIEVHANTLEARFKETVKQEQRRYWGNIVGVFGVFVSVLALIITGLPKIVTDPSLPFLTVVQLNLAQLLPLTLVLAIFVLVLRWVIR